MANNTISTPDFETLNVDNKTVKYSCLDADVAELIGSIRWDAASVLNWRLRSSAWFAHQILMRMGGEEFIELEIRAVDFAQAFWPGISDDAGRQRIGDLVIKLKEDQRDSGFWMVSIDTDRTKKRDDGSFYHLPTLYKPAEFPSLLYSVQMAAIECDLCEMPLNKRRAHQRSIVESWLINRGCKRIIREKKEKKEKSEKEKTPSLPCKCDCASCASCALRGATVSEAGGARPAQERITGETIDAKIDAGMELIFGSGQDWLNTERPLPDWVKKIHARFDIEELRLRDAMKRANAPRLKLVGGQSR